MPEFSNFLVSLAISLLVSWVLFGLAYFQNPLSIYLMDSDLVYQVIFILSFFFIFSTCISSMCSTFEHTHFIAVLAQLACFLFNFKYTSERARLLLNVCFFGSIISHLYLTSIPNIALFSLVLLLFLFFLFSLPQILVHFIISFLYMHSEPLFLWSFYLSFFQIIYFIIMILFEKGNGRGLFWVYLLINLFQTYLGICIFDTFFFSSYIRLAGLVSGACILYLCVEREGRAFPAAFGISFGISLLIGIMLAPSDPALLIFGISRGLFTFLLFHFMVFQLSFFYKIPRDFIPFFYGGLFFLLNRFPQLELGFLSNWIQGIDLLIFLLVAISCFDKENEGGGGTVRGK